MVLAKFFNWIVELVNGIDSYLINSWITFTVWLAALTLCTLNIAAPLIIEDTEQATVPASRLQGSSILKTSPITVFRETGTRIGRSCL